MCCGKLNKMEAELFYLDEGHVKVTAASVGISKKRWTSIEEGEIKNQKYKETMRVNRYDVLPIISRNKTVERYFKTELPNKFDKIDVHTISNTDLLPYDTDIREVIGRFSRENRTHYFLTTKNEITGLITLGNLNCRQVQVYIFSKICDLERTLADFINDNLKNDDIRRHIKDKAKTTDKFKIILYNYQELISLDLENKLTEHLYLVDFLNIVSKFELYKNLKLSKKELEDYSSINELRNSIAHPTRTLLDGYNDIQKLSTRLVQLDNFLSKLTDHREKAAAKPV